MEGAETCFLGLPLGRFAACEAESSPNKAFCFCLYPVPGGRPSRGCGPYVTGLGTFPLPLGRPRLRGTVGGGGDDDDGCGVSEFERMGMSPLQLLG